MNNYLYPVLLALGSAPSYADFFTDQKASITSRNFYFDRDYQDPNAPYPALKEWAQGLIFNYQSGYTEGPIQFGVDVSGDVGLKLDSTWRHTATGLLKYDAQTRQADDEYHRLFATGKVLFRQSELNYGALKPRNPVIFSSPARLFDQMFHGLEFRSQLTDSLKFVASYIDKVKQRDHSSWSDVSISKVQRRYGFAPNDTVESSHFFYTGVDYTSKGHLGSYYYGNLHDVYQTHVGSYVHHKTEHIPLQVKFQVYRSTEQGRAQVGHIDNWNIGGLFGVAVGEQIFSLGGSVNYGETALPFLHGGEAPTFLDSMSADFTNKDERVWTVRFERTFKNVGLPNLYTMLRYSKGVNIELDSVLGGSSRKERALDADIRYSVSSGFFEGLSLRLRHTIYRNNFTVQANYKNGNETRINADYTWRF